MFQKERAAICFERERCMTQRIAEKVVEPKYLHRQILLLLAQYYYFFTLYHTILITLHSEKNQTKRYHNDIRMATNTD